MRSHSGQRLGWTRGVQAAAAGMLALLLVAGHRADAAEPAAGAPLAVEMFFRHADLGAARLSPSL